MRVLPKPSASSASGNENPEARATLAEHLEELRGRLIKVFVAVCLAAIIGWILTPPVYDTVSEIGRAAVPEGVEYKEAFDSIFAPFFLHIKLALMIGVILCFPYIVLQVWGFVKPGLRPHERRPLKIVVPVSAILFFAGALICWLSIPIALQAITRFVFAFEGTAIYQVPGTLVQYVLLLVLSFGIAFQLPLVVFFLTRVGIITPETLSQYWRQAILGIFIFCAVVTPADPITMVVMGAPLTVLFFLSILVAGGASRSQRRPSVLDNLD